MASLSVQGVAKSFGGRELFSDLTFDAAAGDRVAVVGYNGSGKSTLLRLLIGEADPDGGRIVVSRGARIGYAAQELSDLDLDEHLLTWVMGVLPSWGDFWREWEEAADAGDQKRLERLSQRQAHLEQTFGYNPEHQAGSILHGLGFTDEQFHKPMRTLSGGWRERAKLARVLLAGADILILDEPTNHLDLEAVEWLEQFLLAYTGVLVFVVHERVFLDNVASHVLYLGSSRPTFKRGNFTQFLIWQDEMEKVRESQAAKLEARIEHQMDYIRRFRAKARKASQAQSKLRQVEKMREELGGLEAERRRKILTFSMPQPKRGDKAVVSGSNLNFAFPGREPLWPDLNFNIYRGQKVALAGPNGAGKSTLLKLVVGEFAPTRGRVSVGPLTKVGYFSQHQAEILDPGSTVVGELRKRSDPRTTEEELRGVLGLFLLGEDYFERPIRQLSGGEKSRLSLAMLFLARADFIVMDEPTNHLDMESREGLVTALQSWEGTLLLVAHDRYLLAECAEEIWAIDEKGIVVHLGGFAEYDAARRAEGKTADSDMPRSEKETGDDGPQHRRLDKDAKRRQAEIRNRFSKNLKPLQDAYAAAEAELEKVTGRQSELENVLADPATYEDKERFVRLTTEYKHSKDREEELFQILTGLEEQIGELEAARERELSQVA